MTTSRIGLGRFPRYSPSGRLIAYERPRSAQPDGIFARWDARVVVRRLADGHEWDVGWGVDPVWLDDATVLARRWRDESTGQDAVGVWLWAVGGGAPVVLSPTSYRALTAGGGLWGGHLAAASQGIEISDGRQIAGAGRPTLGPDGRLAYVADAQAERQRLVVDGEGPIAQTAIDGLAICRRAVAWMQREPVFPAVSVYALRFGETQPARVGLLPVGEWEGLAGLVDGPDGPWLLSYDDRRQRLLIRPLGATEGWAIAGVTDAPGACIVDGALRVAYAVPASRRCDLYEAVIPLSTARVDLRPPATPPPPPRPTWISDPQAPAIEVGAYLLGSRPWCRDRTVAMPADTYTHARQADHGETAGVRWTLLTSGAQPQNRACWVRGPEGLGLAFDTTPQYPRGYRLVVPGTRIPAAIYPPTMRVGEEVRTPVEVLDLGTGGRTRFVFIARLHDVSRPFAIGDIPAVRHAVIGYRFDHADGLDERNICAEGLGAWAWEERRTQTGALERRWEATLDAPRVTPVPPDPEWLQPPRRSAPPDPDPDPEPEPEPEPEHPPVIWPSDAQAITALQRLQDCYLHVLRRPRGLFTVPDDGLAWALTDPETGTRLDTRGVAVWLTRYARYLDEARGDHERAIRRLIDEIRATPEGQAANPTPDPHVPPPGDVLPLRVQDRRYFVTDAGPVDYREVSAFALLSRYIQGHDIRPFLRWWRGRKACAVRVLGTLGGYFWDSRGFPCGPHLDGFYDALVPFARTVASEGFYLRLCLIGAIEPFGGIWYVDRRDDFRPEVRARARLYVERVATALRDEPNVLFEVANEWNQIGLRDSTDRVIELGHAVKGIAPHRLLALSNTNGPIADEPIFVRAPADYVSVHFDRRRGMQGFEWVKRTGESPVVDHREMAVLSGEPINFGALGVGGPQDHEPNPAVAFCYGAVSRTKRYYTTFHYDGGLWADVPDDQTASCADAWRRGLDAIPIDAMRWGWCNGHHGCSPWRADGTFPPDGAHDNGDWPFPNRIYGVSGARYYGISIKEPHGWDHRRHARRDVRVVDHVDGSNGWGATVYEA